MYTSDLACSVLADLSTFLTSLSLQHHAWPHWVQELSDSTGSSLKHTLSLQAVTVGSVHCTELYRGSYLLATCCN